MKFTYPGAKRQETIKSCKPNDEGGYVVEYFDGSTLRVDGDLSIKNIKEKMLIQAKAREIMMGGKYSDLNIGQICLITALIIQTLAAILVKVTFKNQAILAFYSVLIAWYGSCLVKASREKKELKKYRLFLEMAKDLDKINDPDFLTCIMPEKLYQTPVDITTIDDISTGDMKILYKKYKKEVVQD